MRGLLVILFLICSVGSLACRTSATSAPETDSPPGMLERPATIESFAIDVSATDSSQSNLVLVSGLLNACYTFGHYSLTRDGDIF